MKESNNNKTILLGAMSAETIRRVWRYQRGNHNANIEEEQTTQWPKESVQKDKQRSTKHTHKTKDRVNSTSLKTGGELMFSERACSSCSTSDTRRVNLVTNPVISREWRNIAIILLNVFPYDEEYCTQFRKCKWKYNESK